MVRERTNVQMDWQETIMPKQLFTSLKLFVQFKIRVPFLVCQIVDFILTYCLKKDVLIKTLCVILTHFVVFNVYIEFKSRSCGLFLTRKMYFSLDTTYEIRLR